MRSMFVKRKESKSSLDTASQYASSQYTASKTRSRAASSVSSDNNRQKAEQVTTVLASLGPMLGPARPRATSKSETTTKNGPSDGYRRPAQDSRGQLLPNPWDRNPSGKLVAAVDPDEEFCSFPRVRSPPNHHPPNPEVRHHPPYAVAPTAVRAEVVQSTPRPGPNVIRKDSSQSIRRIGSVDMLSSRGILPPEGHASPSYNPRSPHEAENWARSRSKSVGAAQQRERARPVEHIPALPSPAPSLMSPLAPSPRASPRPRRPARPPTADISAVLSEGGWADDDPFARLPPPDASPVRQPAESPGSSGSTSPVWPISSIKGKKSMPNMEGARQKFLVDTDADLGTMDPSWRPSRIASHGSVNERTNSVKYAPVLARSFSADASGLLRFPSSPAKEVVSPPRTVTSMPALSQHLQQSSGSSGGPPRSPESRQDSFCSNLTSESSSASSSYIPTDSDGHGRTSKIIDSYFTTEEYSRSSSPSPHDASDVHVFPTAPRKFLQHQKGRSPTSAHVERMAADRLPPIVTNVARAPLFTPPLDTPPSTRSSVQSAERHLTSPYTPFTPQYIRSPSSFSSSSSATAPFSRSMHSLPLPKSPPQGPPPHRPPTLLLPSAGHTPDTPTIRAPLPDSESYEIDVPPLSPPSFLAFSPPGSAEPGVETFSLYNETPLAPALQSALKVDMFRAGSHSQTRRQQRGKASLGLPQPDRSRSPSIYEGEVEFGYAV